MSCDIVVMHLGNAGRFPNRICLSATGEQALHQAIIDKLARKEEEMQCE